MKKFRHLTIFILAAALLAALSGCGTPKTSSSTPQQPTVPSASVPSAPAAPAATPSSSAPSPVQSAKSSPAVSSSSPSAAQTSGSTQPVECNWSLKVDDTKTGKLNGYYFTCTLTISAVKKGGKDDMGKYSGTASLKYEYNMAKGSVSGNAKGNGQDQNVSVELVPYSTQKYADLTPSAPLAPLVTYDSMASGSLNFTGSGLSQENANGASWTTGESKAVAVPYRMVIVGGQVTIELYTLAPAMFFSGMITGTPAG